MDNKPIYTITVMSKLEEFIYNKGTNLEKRSGFPDFGDCRVVGFYHDKDTAIRAVEGNWENIREGYYNYAVVEEVFPRIYPENRNRWFFQYNLNFHEYKEINEPAIVEHFINIGIG